MITQADILVVDDEHTTRLMTVMLVEKLRPRSVHSFGDAAAALRFLASEDGESVAVALVDYRMPGMDGIEFFTRAKKIQPALQAALCTAVLDRGVLQDALRTGFFDQRDKPLTDKAVATTVRKGLEKNQEERRRLDALARATEIHAQMSELAKQRERLHFETNELRGQLDTQQQVMAGWLHNTANPLAVANSLAGYLEEVVEGKNGEAVETTAALKRNIGLAAGMLRRLQNRLDGRHDTEIHPDAELRWLAAQVRLLYRRALEEKCINLTVTMDSNMPEVWLGADALDLVDLVINLVKNAIEASAAGGGITVSCVGPLSPRLAREQMCDAVASVGKIGDETQWGCLTVEDSGEGISPQVAERLFIDRVTTKERGSGHGLTRAAAVVVAAKGSLCVHSTPGEGTRFTMLIPARTLGGKDQRPVQATRL